MDYRDILVKRNLIPNDGKMQYNVKCPFHNEFNGASLHINFSRNMFRCFSGKCINIKGNLKHLLELLGVDVTDRYQFQPISVTVSNQFLNNIKKAKELEPFDLKEFQKFHTFDYSYLQNRGISAEICRMNHISYSNYHKRIWIPLFENGVCYGCMGRSVLKDEEIRYKNTWNFPKEACIFAPQGVVKHEGLCLVMEGAINALTGLEMGYKSVSICGSYPTEIQIKKIFEYAGDDNDVAGTNNTAIFRKKYGKIVARVDYNKLKIFRNDCNDCNEKEVVYLIENRTFL